VPPLTQRPARDPAEALPHLLIINVEPHDEAARGIMVQHARPFHDAARGQVRMARRVAAPQRQPCQQAQPDWACMSWPQAHCSIQLPHAA